MFGDNPDFYPTPRKVARLMLAKITKQRREVFPRAIGRQGRHCGCDPQPIYLYVNSAARSSSTLDASTARFTPMITRSNRRLL